MQWNLEQLRLFVSVAEQRSFSAVARDQRKAQSAVSSSIALLEEDLGVSLFDRSSGRQPKLTEAGNALLDEAREVLRQCERLNGRALAMMRGQEARLRLAQDEAMPYQPIIESFEALAEKFPSLEVQLTSAAQGDVARKLVERRADLGLLFLSRSDSRSAGAAGAGQCGNGHGMRRRIIRWRSKGAGGLPATGAASAVADVHAVQRLSRQ